MAFWPLRGVQCGISLEAHRRTDGLPLRARAEWLRSRARPQAASATSRAATHDEFDWDVASSSGPSSAQLAEMDREAQEFAESFSLADFGGTLTEPNVDSEAGLNGGEEAAAAAGTNGRRRRAARRTGRPIDTSIPLHCLPKVAHTDDLAV